LPLNRRRLGGESGKSKSTGSLDCKAGARPGLRVIPEQASFAFSASSAVRLRRRGEFRYFGLDILYGIR